MRAAGAGGGAAAATPAGPRASLRSSGGRDDRRVARGPRTGSAGGTPPAPARGRPDRPPQPERCSDGLLVHAAQRLGLGLALLRIVADAEAEPRAGRDPLAALLALGDVEEDRASFVVVEEAEALLGEEAVDDADPALLGGRVGSDLVEDGELGREGRVGRGGRLVPHPAGGEGCAAGREHRVIRHQTPERLQMAGGVTQAPELLGQIGGQAERVRETALAPAGERPLRLREGSARAGAGEVQARQLEADRGLGAEQALHRLDQRLRRLGEPARDVEVEAAEREERERAPREQGGAAVGGLGGLDLAAQLVHPPEALPVVARFGIEVARRGEGGERGVEVATPQLQLAAAGERVLLTDGGRVVAAVERAALVERLGGALEVDEIAQPAREVEEHLYLHAAAALPLLARRVLPDPARAAERLDRFARAVHLLEAVAAAEEAEVVGREGGEGAVVPAQRLRPLLLALEVPADGAVEHGRAPRGELGAAQEVALDLLLVAEQAEGAADLVEELGRVPGLALGRVVDRAVARDDGVQLAAVGERADLGEDGVDVHQGPAPVTWRVVRKWSFATWPSASAPWRATKARPAASTGGPAPFGSGIPKRALSASSRRRNSARATIEAAATTGSDSARGRWVRLIRRPRSRRARSRTRASPNWSEIASRHSGMRSSRFSMTRAWAQASSRFRLPTFA